MISLKKCWRARKASVLLCYTGTEVLKYSFSVKACSALYSQVILIALNQRKSEATSKECAVLR